MNITDNIKYVGVNDHDVDLFEGQYAVPNGMAYNSYVILDEKTAVMDSVDTNFVETWMENISAVLGGKRRTISLSSIWSRTIPQASPLFWNKIPKQRLLPRCRLSA